mmetsp:Transcript_9901/g.25680  ORF Transcript_9901/g.25680 Transcript_9901/m.25680 type:complete len:230 (-) Transcript_9901:111-800(-)
MHSSSQHRMTPSLAPDKRQPSGMESRERGAGGCADAREADGAGAVLAPGEGASPSSAGGCGCAGGARAFPAPPPDAGGCSGAGAFPAPPPFELLGGALSSAATIAPLSMMAILIWRCLSMMMALSMAATSGSASITLQACKPASSLSVFCDSSRLWAMLPRSAAVLLIILSCDAANSLSFFSARCVRRPAPRALAPPTAAPPSSPLSGRGGFFMVASCHAPQGGADPVM